MDMTKNSGEQALQTAVVEEKDLEEMINKYKYETGRFEPTGKEPEEKERFRHLVKCTGFSTFHVKPNYCFTWIDECIKNKDWAGLCRIINQRFKSAALPNIYGGYNHEKSPWCVLEALACGNIGEDIKRVLPFELSLVKNCLEPFAPVASHLLIGLWYKDKVVLDEGVFLGERFLGQKKSKTHEKALTSFLIDLAKSGTEENVDESMEKMSQDLLEVCKSYLRYQQYPSFCVQAHGLYNLASIILSEEKFKLLQMPKHKVFLADYAKWLLQKPKADRSLFYRYPDEMKWVNEIMEAPCAKLALHQFWLNDPNAKPKKREEWSAFGVKWVNDFADEMWDKGIGHSF